MSPSALPEGQPAPLDGSLPPGVALSGSTFSAYVHVPFCRVRCGYCDFNTYAPGELRGPGSTTSAFVEAFHLEVALAKGVLANAAGSPAAGSPAAGSPAVGAPGATMADATPERVPPTPLETVFFGGGTPTLLPVEELVGMLATLRATWGFVEGAEMTIEANPDSVTPQSLSQLADGGFTRISIGMQSAVPHVLATLERTHDPANVERAVAAAKEVGLQVSVDLIYATPGESLVEWERSVRAALALEPDHISAYALVVEDGTKLANHVRRGLIALPDDDDAADKYELADRLFTEAGYPWYEVSNWARPGRACRHNVAYWRSGDWWGFGPGAHSHVAGARWWNVKHPSAYAARLAAGESPAAAREVLSDGDRATETVLLGIRLAEGLPVAALGAEARAELVALENEGLIERSRPGRVVVTRRGRLLADALVRRLVQ